MTDILAYKQVARVGGRLVSIFDGTTEYVLGHVHQHPTGVPGGYYAYDTFDEAANARVPATSALRIAPRVVLACRAWGARYRHPRTGKTAYEFLEPLEVLNMPLGYTAIYPGPVPNASRRPPPREVVRRATARTPPRPSTAHWRLLFHADHLLERTAHRYVGEGQAAR